MSEDGQRLDDVVRRFAAACGNGDGAELEQFLPPPADPLRLAALHELVKLDLEAQWRRGRQVRIEDYLPRFPELGTARTVPAALIVAEFRARVLFGDQPALDVYQRRFPDQFPECERLARAGALLDAPTEAKVAEVVQEVVLPVKPPARPPQVVGPGAPSATPSFVPQSGGYQLLEKIGSGGFAEVWRAEAPGGIPAAIKKLFRSMEHEEAQRELAALEAVKRLRHPYLLQTQQTWVSDGHLYLAMELAEGSLRERLKECRKAGLQGIPAVELMGYMREAAEALDYLHANHVQHRDIKPDNILLLQGHAKVADFGLARLQERQVSMSVTGSGTPAYMPPEAWAGKLHSSSDLYSFAVAYVELRLDRRPFAGASPAEMMMAHLQATPDLTPLRADEQRVVLRALSREPGERFGSCREFVRALEAAQPEELEPPRTQKSIAMPPPPLESSLGPRGGMPSGERTDQSMPPVGWRGRRPSNVSDTDVRRTAWYGSWRGTKRGGALPVVVLLLACIPLVGVSVAIITKMVNNRTRGGAAVADGVDWVPANFEKAGGAEVVTEGGKRYYDKIDRKLKDGTRIPFVLVQRNPPGQPRGEDVGAFYIMVDKVSVDLFKRVVDEGPVRLQNSAWEQQGTKGNQPVLSVIAIDAFHWAQHVGGNLPKAKQWDKAAGLFRGPEHGNPPGKWPAPWDRGPFVSPWDAKDGKQVAVNRTEAEGPLDVGAATRDQAWSGCRDMAGNGLELTRDLLSGEEVPLLDREPGKEDKVIQRGQMYTDDSPLTFRDLERADHMSSVGYNVPGIQTSFRVVVEVPGG